MLLVKEIKGGSSKKDWSGNDLAGLFIRKTYTEIRENNGLPAKLVRLRKY